ncbi:MAG TPA: tRNA pseudouridine(38-40) synthase TruA [Ilumatobacteraceae bacterium]|nr:tRNA pseudouridine(38-40) synthase TruA [Ilumatobacteraceae bacterium]
MTLFDAAGTQADTQPGGPGELRRVRLTVAYDGEPFHGFAENDGVRTVMGDLRAAIETVCRMPVELTGAGRTDAGVHGWGQVVSGDLPAPIDLNDLRVRVTKMCGPSIVVRDAAWTAADFSARFSAEWRHYRYHVLNAPAPNPFTAHRAWHVAKPLRLWAMQAAADALIGEHDFSAFCRRPKVAADQPQPSMTRRVISTRWSAVDDDERPGLLRFEIRANAFCHQMVRSIVGTLVDVGAGKLTPGDIRPILLSKDRARAGQVAPPHGLCLWEVSYPPDELPAPSMGA